ncbi:DUF4159 domain-containing protein [Martelella mediterranea]|uniref:Putative membrane protein (TIGR02226 family) n=1 Tax=Martelella mediterranea TaxID=293089 RepID=A0A4R3NX00_9HYPH|nr:DUF4159 domain-containing protein [Martelella mediterranea]TCT44894.1 putative membrane protein (TIGR02226 family) [Martelella mediterranea]
MSALAFASPFVLIALVVLPAIWWLLKLTPPRPKREVFPPLAILLKLTKRDETPARSPWWLTLLRMVLASLVILAIANPIINPDRTEIVAGKPLALMIDNGWASAEDWDDRVHAAENLINAADEASQPVMMVFTADKAHAARPVSVSQARERLAASQPRPLKPERARAAEALSEAFEQTPPGTLALISDGLTSEGDAEAMNLLAGSGAPEIVVSTAPGEPPAALTRVENDADATRIFATRADTGRAADMTVNAYDIEGRAIASAPLRFDTGVNTASTEIRAPFEVRNDFARIAIDSAENAGAVQLLDDGFRRRRVALVGGAPDNEAQPLLTPAYYLEKAIAPYADLITSDAETMPEKADELLEQNPSVLLLSDVGTMPEETHAAIESWVESGGTLIRFAGPRLAASGGDDSLLPVRLRLGERAFGGAMSWSAPQSLAPFPPESPFYGLPAPDDIAVTRQVLAEPSVSLSEHTWASLADGTPLVTEARLGDGQLVLFHTSSDANWSNLPISGYFVEMLRRIVNLSRASTISNGNGVGAALLPPYRMLDASGTLASDVSDAKPFAERAGDGRTADYEHPPGLYGTADGFVALNLFGPDDQLSPFDINAPGNNVRQQAIGQTAAISLKPWLLAAALVLLIVDGIIILLMNGALTRLRLRRSATLMFLLAILASLPMLMIIPENARAQMSDSEIAELLYETHLAYVETGEADVDRISERGLKGLSNFIAYRTALEPGDPIGVDPATDELAFYPLIYWPVSASAPMPSQEAIARIEAYMRNGGTVLFDTRDEYSPLGSGAVSPNTERLRAILNGIDVPPLEPVPEGHVLTRSFYLLSDFPGRYDGSPLWVEARAGSDDVSALQMSGGDGVSPIIITGNDFAGAWAINADSTPMLPTVPENPRQRQLAYRTGVNIVMYMLTGNYKADQVHIPALLERLGQ